MHIRERRKLIATMVFENCYCRLNALSTKGSKYIKQNFKKFRQTSTKVELGRTVSNDKRNLNNIKCLYNRFTY